MLRQRIDRPDRVITLRRNTHRHVPRSGIEESSLFRLRKSRWEYLGKNPTKKERLGLTKTNITNAGLIHLKKLHGLRDLILNVTGVSNAGIEEMRAALPEAGVLTLKGPTLPQTNPPSQILAEDAHFPGDIIKK